MRLTQPPPEPTAGGSSSVATRPKSPQSLAWKASLTAHFLLLRALYQGRIGEDNKVKLVLKSLYNLIDDSTDKGYLDAMRESGGIVEVRTPSGPPQSLYVQSTPINVLYTLTYLTTIVSRREFLGSSATCRTLVHSRAMREWEDVARADDFWDSGFSQVHGLAEALRMRKVMATLKAEGMMEEALAHIIRSSFAEADKVLTDTVRHLRRCNLFNSHLPQLSLLYAQFTHVLGLSDSAVRYYRAAQSMITPGSELRLVVDVGLLSASGGLEGLRDSHERSQYVNMLADACRSGNNALLSAVGSFLSSLTETERVISKRFLSNAYELARKGNLNVLHCLIFAFTTGAHVYGDSERQLKQLESGRSIAQMLGGMDRADNVGQTILGLWYAVKLRGE
ncbi:hypothetical protein VHUM_01751 [Vanrija humicola]|uniref:Anaphase-promoting complex subunit 5 n=1 Tax=Vanrija humicola TaxID=5417 RepID=A0A7D8Z4R2_VANHU|nr:hypothetical protein VHUM_01751 [Vanrija humicola]